MYRGLVAYEESHTVDHRDHCRKPNAIPLPTVNKTSESIGCIFLGAQNKERDEDSKPSYDVEDEKDNLHCRQARREDGIDDEAKNNNGPREERGFPSLCFVRWVVERSKTLHRSRRRKGYKSQITQPAHGYEPTCSPGNQRSNTHPRPSGFLPVM